jgi:5-methylcytosine-specific restriction endonuclease McrA
MREFAKHFYHSKAWKQCRLSYIASVHGLCERCEAGGKIVHHKVYLNERNIGDPTVTLSHENLELLCQTCHNIEHMEFVPTAKGLVFSANGDVISR